MSREKGGIAIIGTGYVGLVTGTCFARLGNRVVCADIDREKIKKLQKGKMPFYEPGLDVLIRNNLAKGNLSFSNDLSQAICDNEIIIIAVGTPAGENGGADLSFVKNAAEEIGKNMAGYKMVVVKSTVPPGTCKKIREIIGNIYDGDFDVVSNPEFLREGSAVSDFMKPDRVIIGVENNKVKGMMKNIYSPLKSKILFTSVESSEMIKYASNAFLATKISFINEIANLCEKIGADVEEVSKGMGLDSRIGKAFLKAGIGYGGSCFPKDVRALSQTAGVNGYNFCLLKSVIEVNNNQKRLILNKAEKLLGNFKGKTIAVWGLSFKANTDDVRESVAIEIIEALLGKGARIKAYCPMAMPNAKKVLSDSVMFCKDPYEAINGSDMLFIATEWDELKDVDLQKMKMLLKKPYVVDGKNIFAPKKMNEEGFVYISVGRT